LNETKPTAIDEAQVLKIDPILLPSNHLHMAASYNNIDSAYYNMGEQAVNIGRFETSKLEKRFRQSKNEQQLILFFRKRKKCLRRDTCVQRNSVLVQNISDEGMNQLIHDKKYVNSF
jgi:hypothetical protein